MTRAARPAPAAPAIRYRVAVKDVHTHLYEVTLAIDRPASVTELRLPVWIPGSYLVREFSQHLQNLSARAGRQPLPVQALRKNAWRVRCPEGTAQLEVRYEVYAFDASVRTAFLDQTRGFFNPTSLCLYVVGRQKEPHGLHLARNAQMAGWSVATAMRPLQTRRDGFGEYWAEDYDELADHPFTLGELWSGSFDVRGVPHRFVVTGAGPTFDGERLLRDTQSLCETQMQFWHGSLGADGQGRPPFDRYVFMLHATHDGYGGLEHRHSTALICQRSDLPRRADAAAGDPGAAKPGPQDGYVTLLGLISHEYFHTWNVKRLRPRSFASLDYDQENYTELLWFFEGFTSYYDDLLALRAGCIDEATYLQLLTKTINQVLQTPGRRVQSVAQASFDAWIKYYRVQENTPNATVSYYTKGSLVALCLDLTLRAEGHTTLDAVMRHLFAHHAQRPITEADLLRALKTLGRRDFSAEIQAWVHGTADLPLKPLLEQQGVQWQDEAAPLAQRLGVRVASDGGLVLKHVLRGSPAEQAGLAAGDEWLALETPGSSDAASTIWRIRRLEDALVHAQTGQTVIAWVNRDGRVLQCPLRWPEPAQTVRLSRPRDAATAPSVAWPVLKTP